MEGHQPHYLAEGLPCSDIDHVPLRLQDLDVYSRHAKQLNHFNLSCLRRVLHIRLQDDIPDTEGLERTGITIVHTLRQKAQA